MTRDKETITIELRKELKQKSEVKKALSDKNISDIVREALQDWTQDVNIEIHDLGDSQTSFSVSEDESLIEKKR